MSIFETLTHSPPIVCRVTGTTWNFDSLPGLITACRNACLAIENVRRSADLGTSIKTDNSPLTRADLESNGILAAYLGSVCPNIPMISEESEQMAVAEGQMHFLVDPLDGTKEFLSGSGDYTVNVALILAGRPVVGVVAHPPTETVYLAVHGQGCWKISKDGRIQLLNRKQDSSVRSVRVVVSRSHLDADTVDFLKGLEESGVAVESVAAGSSLKFCRVAEGAADIYPRFGPTMEWDTAAGDLVAAEAGAPTFRAGTSEVLLYGKTDRHNPEFICWGTRV